MIAPTNTINIEPQAGFRAILKDEVRFASGRNETGDRLNGSFDRLMLQSGIQTSPSVWLMLSVLMGLTIGGIAFVVTEGLVLTTVGFLIGLLIPIGIAANRRSQRQKAIMEQLPGMAEELARAARAGRSIEHSLQMVAADTAAPLGDELKLVVRRCDMGLDPGAAVQDLSERTGVPSLTMFASAIKVHQDTGGDLIQVLERFATAIRDRLHFVNRLRAATIASRMGAVLMLVFPPMIVVFYMYRDPTYLQQLLSSFWGRFSLGGAIALQVIGALAVFRILKRSARF